MVNEISSLSKSSFCIEIRSALLLVYNETKRGVWAMNTKRIRVSYARDEKTPPNIFSDHDWVRRNEENLLTQYGERCIVVYKEAVIGIGDTYEAAIEDAENNLPPEMGEVTPIVELLHHRHPFLRVRPGPVDIPARQSD
jgi:hypothetical protein